MTNGTPRMAGLRLGCESEAGHRVPTTLVAAKIRRGLWKCDDRLRLDRLLWNHKLLRRIYCRAPIEPPSPNEEAAPGSSGIAAFRESRPHAVCAVDIMSGSHPVLRPAIPNAPRSVTSI